MVYSCQRLRSSIFVRPERTQEKLLLSSRPYSFPGGPRLGLSPSWVPLIQLLLSYIILYLVSQSGGRGSTARAN